MDSAYEVILCCGLDDNLKLSFHKVEKMKQMKVRRDVRNIAIIAHGDQMQCSSKQRSFMKINLFM